MPGYNKTEFHSKSSPIVMLCLDYFNNNPTVNPQQKISDTLTHYSTNSKDWKYYFLKYESFREGCNYGYYAWRDKHYCIWKMGKRQFNGYHWDPFLYEIKKSAQLKNLKLENFESKLEIIINNDKILISSVSNGFLFENGNGNGATNKILKDLSSKAIINNEGILEIFQDSKGIDLEDRIDKLKKVITNL